MLIEQANNFNSLINAIDKLNLSLKEHWEANYTTVNQSAMYPDLSVNKTVIIMSNLLSLFLQQIPAALFLVWKPPRRSWLVHILPISLRRKEYGFFPSEWRIAALSVWTVTTSIVVPETTATKTWSSWVSIVVIVSHPCRDVESFLRGRQWGCVHKLVVTIQGTQNAKNLQGMKIERSQQGSEFLKLLGYKKSTLLHNFPNENWNFAFAFCNLPIKNKNKHEFWVAWGSSGHLEI